MSAAAPDSACSRKVCRRTCAAPRAGGALLIPAHLLYLATRAGAEALGWNKRRRFQPGKAADLVYLRPPRRQSAGSGGGAGRRCGTNPGGAVHAGGRGKRARGSRGRRGGVSRFARSMTIARSEFSGARAVRRRHRLGLRTFAVGGRASLGHAPFRDIDALHRSDGGSSGAAHAGRTTGAVAGASRSGHAGAGE